ncbi:hypothetical protein AB0J43_06025 [Nonomuraea fuscirosea]
MGIAMIRHGRANMALAARIAAAGRAVARQQRDRTRPPDEDAPADPPAWRAHETGPDPLPNRSFTADPR